MANPTLSTLAAAVRALGLPEWKKRTVELVLGTDREIGRKIRSTERRVGVTPAQVEELVEFCRALGLELRVLVLRGAGVRAGFSDGDYIRRGAEIITIDELPFHDAPPDVFHALKEPSTYEHLLPGPFCRIGALHSGNFQRDGGIPLLVGERPKAGVDDEVARREGFALFDGSNIGTPFRNPVRGKMSEFAGQITATWVRQHLDYYDLQGRVVVVGGGRAGLAALDTLLADPRVTEIHLLDDEGRPRRIDELRQQYAGDARVSVFGISGLDHERLKESLTGCVGSVFAVFRSGGKAPKVVHVDTIRSLPAPGSIIVDISIDEKGAIQDPKIRPSWEAEQIIQHLERTIQGHRYRTSDNMPRNRPHEASIAHGEVVLPYLATLLYLAAREGGADGVIRCLRRQAIDLDGADPAAEPPERLLDALVQDLRNGMILYSREVVEGGPPGTSRRRVVVEDAVADRRGLFGFLVGSSISFEFTLRLAPTAEDGGEEGAEDPKAQFEPFPSSARECLEFAYDRGIESQVIFHPQVDGTRSEDAARAIGVDVSDVVKCMVLLADEKEFWAAICNGTERISLERVGRLIGAEQIRLAHKDEVYSVTGHSPGGVPVIQIFDLLDSRVLVDREVMAKKWVVGSAGTEYIGMLLEPAMLTRLGGRVEEIIEAPGG